MTGDRVTDVLAGCLLLALFLTGLAIRAFAAAGRARVRDRQLRAARVIGAVELPPRK